MAYPRSEAKVRDLIKQTYALEEQAGTLLLKIDENKAKIQKYFDETGSKQMIVPIDESSEANRNLVCKKFERVNVTYDLEKLKEKLDKELLVEITKKTHTVVNMEGLVKLLKKAGIKPSEFKPLISTQEKALNQEIKRLYDAGEISMEQLKGTFKATISKSIKIAEESSEK